MGLTSAVRVQEKGQVTIPLSIRRKLKLKKGDFVAFVETEGGFVLRPAQVLVQVKEAPQPRKKRKQADSQQVNQD